MTDPQLLHLVGLSPMDLLHEIFSGWKAAGLDPVECLRRCVSVTGDFVYHPGPLDLRDRFTPRFVKERSVPIVARNLEEMLNPQPRAAGYIFYSYVRHIMLLHSPSQNSPREGPVDRRVTCTGCSSVFSTQRRARI